MGLLTNLALFAGAAGLEQGAELVGGFRTVGYVEVDRYAQGVIMSRIRGGELDDAPIWDDVTTFDGRSYRGLVDCVSGGFPCQDLSFAGKRAGIVDGKRSGLWKEYARIVGEIRPRFVLVENVPGLLADGALGVVLGDLAELGFDAEWWRLSAADIGAPHLRQRVFVVAYTRRRGLEYRRDAGVMAPSGREAQGEEDQRERSRDAARDSGSTLADSSRQRWGETRQLQGRSSAWSTFGGEVLADASSEGRRRAGRTSEEDGRPAPESYGRYAPTEAGRWWSTEPDVGRVAHGVAFRVDRLRCCGNGVVPDQSVPAWALVKAISEGVIR